MDASYVVAEELEVTGLKFFSDGSFARYDTTEISVPPSPESQGVASRDVTLNNDLGLWLRIYRPPDAQQNLPICLYFHGGGFCTGNPSWKPFHSLCTRIATAAGAMVVSVNYRLAPEHRLPAAYEDCAAALACLHSGAGGAEDPWLRRHSNLSRIFLLGDSAGGNVVHHMALQEMLLPCCGLVMVQPSFAGEARTASEADASLGMKYSDKFREMSLPMGATRDHHYCNPLASVELWERMTLPPMLVVIGGRDIRRDREREYCEALKAQGKDVRVVVFEEEDHGFYGLMPDAESTELLVQEIVLFVKAHC